jgi:hypothetical protein
MRAPGDLIEVKSFLWGGLLEDIVIYQLLVAGNQESVACLECDAVVTVMRQDGCSYDHGPLAMGAGTRWLCPQGHELFRCYLWQS